MRFAAWLTKNQRHSITGDTVDTLPSRLIQPGLARRMQPLFVQPQRVFHKGGFTKTFAQNGFSDRNSLTTNQGKGESRGRKRVVPIFSAIIYEKRNLKNRGTIRDLSNAGCGVHGLATEVGESKTLVVIPGYFLDFQTFSFQAICHCTGLQKTASAILASRFPLYQRLIWLSFTN